LEKLFNFVFRKLHNLTDTLMQNFNF